MSQKKNMNRRARREFATAKELDQDIQLYVKWYSSGRTQRTTFPFSKEFLVEVGTKIKKANPDKCDIWIVDKDGEERL